MEPAAFGAGRRLIRPLRVAVLLNRDGGRLQREPDLIEQTRAAFAEAGVEAAVEAVPAGRLVERARALIAAGGIDALAVGGGDGTQGAVAALLSGHDMPLGILPFGTLNHFARDAAIPPDIAGAVAVIAAGHVAHVDLAEVNGHVFVNNSSVGLYPLMVRDREHQQRQGRGKWPAMARAAFRAAWRLSRWRLRIHAEGQSEDVETPILFIGNNRYETSLFGLGTRAALDDGQLHLYALKGRTRWALARAVLRALAGRLDQERDFVVIGGTAEAVVESPRRALHVAADGEALTLETPLTYRIRPGALKLIVPLASADKPS